MAGSVQKAQGALVAAGVVGAVGLAGWLVWTARKGIQDLFKGVGQVGKDAAAAATAATASASEGVQFAAAALKPPSQGAEQAFAKPAEFKDTQQQLRLSIVPGTKKDNNSFAFKRTEVTLQVKDQAGNAVPYATVTGVPNYQPSKLALGGIDGKIVKVADYRGYCSLFWKVPNVGKVSPFAPDLIDHEDDITFTARKEGYNPSNSLTVG
jgi:hypothetical protein